MIFLFHEVSQVAGWLSWLVALCVAGGGPAIFRSYLPVNLGTFPWLMTIKQLAS